MMKATGKSAANDTILKGNLEWIKYENNINARLQIKASATSLFQPGSCIHPYYQFITLLSFFQSVLTKT